MIAKRILDPEDAKLPYFEDRLAATNTRRSEWIVGLQNIAVEIGTNRNGVREFFEKPDFPVEKVRPMSAGNSKYTHTYVALSSKLQEWKKRQAMPPSPIPLPLPPSHTIEEDLLMQIRNLLTQIRDLLEDANQWHKEIRLAIRDLAEAWRNQGLNL